MRDVLHLHGATIWLGRTCHSKTRAFTVIELLVVVSLIIMLVALILPSLGESRSAARNAICHVNLDQQQQTLGGYRASPMAAPRRAQPPVGTWVGFISTSGAGAALNCPEDSPNSLAASSILRLLAQPPPDATFSGHRIEDSNHIFVWEELQGQPLPGDIQVNVTEPGFYPKPDTMPGGTVPGGTLVDVYFFHYDAIGNGPANLSGTFTCGGEILGIICLKPQLDATDPVLGVDGTTYDTGRGARGFESGGQDQITLHDDRRTVTINKFFITSPGEEMRIIVKSDGQSGGLVSYGMNNQIETQRNPRGGQLWIMDYEKAIADYDFIGGNNDDPLEWMAPRHKGTINVMFVGGQVESMTVEELDPDRSIWKADPETGIP